MALPWQGVGLDDLQSFLPPFMIWCFPGEQCFSSAFWWKPLADGCLELISSRGLSQGWEVLFPLLVFSAKHLCSNLFLWVFMKRVPSLHMLTLKCSKFFSAWQSWRSLWGRVTLKMRALVKGPFCSKTAAFPTEIVAVEVSIGVKGMKKQLFPPLILLRDIVYYWGL